MWGLSLLPLQRGPCLSGLWDAVRIWLLSSWGPAISVHVPAGGEYRMSSRPWLWVAAIIALTCCTCMRELLVVHFCCCCCCCDGCAEMVCSGLQ